MIEEQTHVRTLVTWSCTLVTFGKL